MKNNQFFYAMTEAYGNDVSANSINSDSINSSSTSKNESSNGELNTTVLSKRKRRRRPSGW